MNRATSINVLENFLDALDNAYADEVSGADMVQLIDDWKENLAGAVRRVRREYGNMNKAECLAFEEAQRTTLRNGKLVGKPHSALFAKLILEALEVI